MVKNQNKIYLTIGIVAIILIAAIVMFLTPKEKETIKIGAVLPLTGKVAYWGQPVQKGMQFAVQEINSAGGINGRLIELIVEDSKADSTEGVTAVNKLLTDDSVLTLSVHTTGVSNAVAPILEQNEVPWITSAADTGLPLKYKYAFKTFYNAYEECKKLVNYGSRKGMTKYGLLLSNMPWGEWCSKGVKEVVGEKNTVNLRYTYGEKDFKTLLLQAKDQNVDGLVWVGFTFESDIINKQKAELGIKIPLLCGYGYECASKASLSELPSDILEGTIIFDFAITDNFKQKYATLSSTELMPAAFGYDEINIIASALAKCKEINRQCLLENLPLVKNYPTALNSNGFDNTKNLIVNTELFEIKDKSFVKIQ